MGGLVVELPEISYGTYGSVGSVGSAGVDCNLEWNPVQHSARGQQALQALFLQNAKPDLEEFDMPEKEMRRFVRIIIADPDANVPLDKAILYDGPERFTDLTDQELFFEVPISELLQKHNDARKELLDRKATDKAGKDVYLEPARIRDLKMQIVTIATF